MSVVGRIVQGFGPWGDVWVRRGWRVQVHCGDGRARVLDPSGVCAVTGDEGECRALAGRLAPAARRRRGVVLLHGILHGRSIMQGMEAALEAAGWAVANVGYPSRRKALGDHATAASLVAWGLAEDGGEEIAFVGHSLGGLVARAAMARADADGWRTGRLVLVGSPARGSAMARVVGGVPGMRSLLGPCGETVTPSGAVGVPMPVGGEVAVIAGGTGGSGFNPLLPGDNDFTVTVAETRLPEAETDFLLVRATHNGLVQKRRTISATIRFLEGGRL